jgi:hypothetical protein
MALLHTTYKIQTLKTSSQTLNHYSNLFLSTLLKDLAVINARLIHEWLIVTCKNVRFIFEVKKFDLFVTEKRKNSPSHSD